MLIPKRSMVLVASMSAVLRCNCPGSSNPDAGTPDTGNALPVAATRWTLWSPPSPSTGVTDQDGASSGGKSGGLAAVDAGEGQFADSRRRRASEADLNLEEGDRLFNRRRFDEAATAFSAALQHGASPARVESEMARVESQRGNFDTAFSALRRAVAAGYRNFSQVERSPDFAPLRAWRGFASRWKRLAPTKVAVTPSALTGRIIASFTAYDVRYFDLCRNGVALEENVCGGFARGKWTLENGSVLVTLEEDCARVGEGTPISASDQCVKFERYTFHGCKPPSESLLILPHEDIKAMLTFRSADDEDEEGEWQWIHEALEKEPRQCDPRFIPKTLEDLH